MATNVVTLFYVTRIPDLLQKSWRDLTRRPTIVTRNSMSEIVVRAADEGDEQFLRHVYFSTRLPEVVAFGWDDTQICAFLEMQFRVREQSYKIQYPSAEYFIVDVGGSNAGSLIVDRSGANIGLTDIAILPEYRGTGIATHLIELLQAEATASSRPLVLTVDNGNVAARRLYEKLNFVVTAEGQFANEMEWRAESS